MYVERGVDGIWKPTEMASYALNGSLVMIPLLQDTHRLLVTNYSVFMKSNYIVASVFFLIFAHG